MTADAADAAPFPLDVTLPASPWAQVPGQLADTLRPYVPALALHMVEVIRREVPEYGRPLEGEFGTAVREGVLTALTAFVDLLGRDEPLPALDLYVALGRAERQQGRTLDALQSAYRVGARTALRALASEGRRVGLNAEVLLLLAEAIVAYIDGLAGASVAGYTAEQTARAGAAQARRQAYIEALVRDPAPDAPDLRRLAQAAGLPPTSAVVVLAVDADDAVEVAGRLPDAVGGSVPGGGLVVVADPRAPGAAARQDAALRGRRAVVGPVVDPEEAPRSARRALACWVLHGAGQLTGATVVRAGDHLLDLLLASTPDVAADLVVRRLAPLETLPAGAATRSRETLRAWLDAHGDVSATAAVLHVHPQTVRYRLGVLREQLGDEVFDDPVARLELELALRVGSQAASGARE